MHDHPSPPPAGPSSSAPTEAREQVLQQAALALLLDAHPAQRSVDELVLELTDRPQDFAARDAILNAIRDLVGAGLAHRHGPFVFASHAAVRFEQLRL